jgi:hypothetical protein
LIEMNVHVPSPGWWRHAEAEEALDGDAIREEVKKVDLDMEGKVAFILYNVLTPEECQHLIDKTEKMGYRPMPGYSPSYRSNTRVIVDDPDRGLTNELWRRLSPFVPDLAETRAVWRPYGLNERWRFCRCHHVSCVVVCRVVSHTHRVWCVRCTDTRQGNTSRLTSTAASVRAKTTRATSR